MHTSKSKQMKLLLQSLTPIAASDVNVLITGETGTGKELLAKRIHSMSPRASRDFVPINCAAIPEALLESELFGHKKGAFTGAIFDHKGLFELADGGTIFLDEIGDMPMSLQAKILRILQDKKIRPVGSNKEKLVDFRLISATNRNLREEIGKCCFREDLFYRLSVIPLHLPSLHQRPEDIPQLISQFSSYFSTKYGFGVLEYSTDAMASLCLRSWPGNVRELENLVEYVTVINQGKGIIEIEDLPLNDDQLHKGDEVNWSFKKHFTISELIDEYICHVLIQVNSHQGEAARILGISRRTISRKLKSQASNSLWLNEHRNNKNQLDHMSEFILKH